MAYHSLEIPFDIRRTRRPISPLPQYFRMPTKLSNQEDADKPFIVLIPIRLGKRHAARFPNLMRHQPYFWEFMKDKKWSVTPNQLSTRWKNTITSPSVRRKRKSEEDTKFFGKPNVKGDLEISNPASTWTDVVHDIYDKIEHDLQNHKKPSTIELDTKHDNINNQVRYKMALNS